MQMDAGLDTGPDAARTRTPIVRARHGRHAARSTRDARCRSDARGARCALRSAARSRGRSRDRRRRTLQKSARTRPRSIGRSSAAEIDRQVRAFNPWPVAETRWNGQQLRIWQAKPLRTSMRRPARHGDRDWRGRHRGRALAPACCRLTRVQAAGRKASQRGGIPQSASPGRRGTRS